MSESPESFLTPPCSLGVVQEAPIEGRKLAKAGESVQLLFSTSWSIQSFIPFHTDEFGPQGVYIRKYRTPTSLAMTRKTGPSCSAFVTGPSDNRSKEWWNIRSEVCLCGEPLGMSHQQYHSGGNHGTLYLLATRHKPPCDGSGPDSNCGLRTSARPPI